MKTVGTPNRTTHLGTNALATASAVMTAIGNAYEQNVKRSTHVIKYVKPFDGGNDPTISRWIRSNRASGVAKVENAVTVCRCVSDL